MYVVEIDSYSEGLKRGVDIAGMYGPFHSRGAAEKWASDRIVSGSWTIAHINDPDDLAMLP